MGNWGPTLHAHSATGKGAAWLQVSGEHVLGGTGTLYMESSWVLGYQGTPDKHQRPWALRGAGQTTQHTAKGQIHTPSLRVRLPLGDSAPLGHVLSGHTKATLSAPWLAQRNSNPHS